MDYLKAVLLAVIEGVTEFLPISSTGHLILAEKYLKLGDDADFAYAFMVVIQLPAILSVVVYFWNSLWPLHPKTDARATFILWSKIIVAFIPALVLGALYADFVEERLSKPIVIATALIMGGVLLVAVERLKNLGTIQSVHGVTFVIAFLIGCFQCLAMIPGTSRSATTIVGALVLGASRPVAAEFSFFLAIPTMFGAAVYTLAKKGFYFSGEQLALLAVGSVVSFFVAYGVIAFLMNFIRKRSFAIFGWYRIALGSLVLLLFL